MADVPPRDPRDPADDETVIVDDAWGPEEQVFVEQTETVPPPRRPPTIWPWLLAFLVLVLAGLAAAYFLTRDDDGAPPPTTATTATTASTTTETTAALVRVPDVVGTTSSEATRALRDVGFDVDVVAVPSDEPPGTVVAQNPAPGSEAAKGAKVRINVARAAAGTTTNATTAPTATTSPSTTTAPAAPQPATVPDVVGQELADAARAFAEEGLKVSVQYVPSDDAAGRVIAQAQPAGTERKRGDTVQVNVSIGAQPAAETPVPDVVGQRQDRARASLAQTGFEVLALNLQSGEVRREDVVASQTPAGGASIPRGSLVILYVTS
jgi:serine/threonine-protein kinase